MQGRSYNDVKKEIRSVLLTYQSSVTLEEFLKTYRGLLGERLPSRALGYHSDVKFLQSMPDVVDVCTDSHGKVHLSGIADPTSQHIQKLVSKQRRPAKNSKAKQKITNQRMPSKSLNIKEQPFLSGTMRAEILKLMESYQDGITLQALSVNYIRRFNKYLPLVRGFDSLEDIVNLIPELEIKLTSDKKRLVCCVDDKHSNNHKKDFAIKENTSSDLTKDKEYKENFQEDGSNIHKSGITENILQNFKLLLEKCPGGILDIHFPLLYEKLTEQNFDVLELGYSSILELVDALPQLFKRILNPDGDKNWIILPAKSPSKLFPRDDNSKSHISPVSTSQKIRQGIPADAASPTLQYMSSTMPQDLNLNEYVPIFVCEVINPNCFWFQLQTENIIEEFEKLEKDIGYFYNNHANTKYKMNDADVVIGATCVVYSPEDGHWYRGVIKSIPCLKKVNVLLIDYGCRENVLRTNLHYVRSKYHEYPAQAFKAQLAGLKPAKNESSWSVKATQRFIQLCESIYLMAYLSPAGKDTFSAYLCDTSGDNDIHIADTLIKEGFAELCIESQHSVDSDSPSNVYKEPALTVSDSPSESLKQNHFISSGSDQISSLSESEISHVKKKLIFSPKNQVNGVYLTIPNKEKGQSCKRYVKQVQLCENSKIHVINLKDKLFMTCGELSKLLWSDKDSSCVIERLKHKEIDLPSVKLAKEAYDPLFEQCIWYKIPEYEKLMSSDSSLIIYPLDCAIKLLNVFGHPSVCLRLAIQNEMRNFNSFDPIWNEFNFDELQDLSDSEKQIEEQLSKLCLYDLKAKDEALKIKRIKLQRVQNTSSPDEIRKIDNLQNIISRKIKQIESICSQFSS